MQPEYIGKQFVQHALTSGDMWGSSLIARTVCQGSLPRTLLLASIEAYRTYRWMTVGQLILQYVTTTRDNYLSCTVSNQQNTCEATTTFYLVVILMVNSEGLDDACVCQENTGRTRMDHDSLHNDLHYLWCLQCLLHEYSLPLSTNHIGASQALNKKRRVEHDVSDMPLST